MVYLSGQKPINFDWFVPISSTGILFERGRAVKNIAVWATVLLPALRAYYTIACATSPIETSAVQAIRREVRCALFKPEAHTEVLPGFMTIAGYLKSSY